MKAAKRVISMLTAMVMASMVCLSGFSETINTSEVNMITSEDVKILDVTKDFLLSIGYGITSEVCVSEAYQLYDVSDSNIEISDNVSYRFVLDGNSLIGMIRAFDIGDSFDFSFVSFVDETIAQSYEADSEIAVVMNNGTTYVAIDGEAFLLYRGENYVYGQSPNMKVVHSLGKRVNTIDASSIADTVEPMVTDTVVYHKELDINWVGNDVSPVNNVQICWAACVAMVKNYYSGVVLSALNVYYHVKNLNNGVEPCGIPFWIMKAYEAFGMTDITYVETGLTGVELKNVLSLNRPVQAILLNQYEEGHAVIISGITVFSDGEGIYYIVDPDSPYVTHQQITVNGMNNPLAIRYTYPNGTLYGWRGTYY